jgi:hypothetical protein
MNRYERFMIWEIQYRPKDNCQNTFESASLSESVSQQGKQTIPYLLMITLKITFYKNIKNVLILGGKKGGGGGWIYCLDRIFFTTNPNLFSQRHWWLIMKMNVMISRMNFLILNKYWECHEITEYLKIYSWSKHVKQINEFLMAMGNTCMWWHFKFLFGQTVFLNCLTECRTSCLWFSICLLLLIFLSYFRSFVKSMVVFLWSCSLLSFVFSFFI